MNNIEIVQLVSQCSPLLPLVCYLWVFKKNPRQNHIIALLVMVSGLTEVAGTILINQKMSNALVLNICAVLFFALYSWFFFELFIRNNKKYLPLFYTGIGFFLGCLIVITSLKGLFQFQFYLVIAMGVVMIAYVIGYAFFFRSSFAPLGDVHLYSNLGFLCGILFYFLCTFAIFFIADFLHTKMDLQSFRVVWAMHNVFNIQEFCFCRSFLFDG